MRIDLLLDSSGFGGIEAHVYELSKALVKSHHEVNVIFFQDYGPHPLKIKLQQHSINIVHINKSPVGAISWLQKQNIDVLHTHGYKAGIIGRLAGRLGAFGVCSSYHAGEPSSGKLALYTWLDKITAPLAQEIIAVSQKIAQTLPRKTKILNNFVEPMPAPSQGQQIAFVGRLSHEKAADRFIHIAKNFPNTQFHIYGDGPLHHHHKNLATSNCEQSNLPQSNVIFHGAQCMEHHWPSIGLVIMPSRHEGLPLAALEAMAYGIPVIATPVGDLTKLIAHNKNGWLLNTPQNAKNIEHTICKQAANYIEHWQQMSAQQKIHIQKNALATITHRYSAKANLPQFIHCYLNAAIGTGHV